MKKTGRIFRFLSSAAEITAVWASMFFDRLKPSEVRSRVYFAILCILLADVGPLVSVLLCLWTDDDSTWQCRARSLVRALFAFKVYLVYPAQLVASLQFCV